MPPNTPHSEKPMVERIIQKMYENFLDPHAGGVSRSEDLLKKQFTFENVAPFIRTAIAQVCDEMMVSKKEFTKEPHWLSGIGEFVDVCSSDCTPHECQCYGYNSAVSAQLEKRKGVMGL